MDLILWKKLNKYWNWTSKISPDRHFWNLQKVLNNAPYRGRGLRGGALFCCFVVYIVRRFKWWRYCLALHSVYSMLPNFRQFPLFLLYFTSHIALQWRRQSYTAKSAKTVYSRWIWKGNVRIRIRQKVTGKIWSESEFRVFSLQYSAESLKV